MIMVFMKPLATPSRLFLIFFLICPVSALSLELTLEQAVDMALENNPDLRIEKKRLENAVSNVVAKKADYIPVANTNLFYNHTKERYETGRITSDDEDYEFSVVQHLPLGGEFSISYGSKSASVVIPGTEKYSSQINVAYKHRLLKDGLFAPPFCRNQERRIRLFDSGRRGCGFSNRIGQSCEKRLFRTCSISENERHQSTNDGIVRTHIGFGFGTIRIGSFIGNRCDGSPD